MQFSLNCNDPAVIERTRQVFRYWKLPSDKKPAIHRVLEVQNSGDSYKVLGLDSDKFAIYKSVNSAVQGLEIETITDIANNCADFLTIHSALLARGDHAILLVGPSLAGKSTTSCALWHAGYQLLTDDLTILDPENQSAMPVLRRVSLRHPSRELLGEDFWNRMLAAETCDATSEGFIFHPDEIEGKSRARSVKLRAIVCLQRRAITPPPVSSPARISEIDALFALSPYTNIVRTDGLGVCMSRLSALVNTVPCYDMGRGTLPEMIDAIDNLLSVHGR